MAAPSWHRPLLAVALVVPCTLPACGSNGSPDIPASYDWEDQADALEELPAGMQWPGSITRTFVLDRQEGGRHMTVWREESWENFRIAGSSSHIMASFDADWKVTERIRETSSDCVYRREARGTASYPWFTFETDPFNELEYRIHTTGTGEMDAVEGTMHGYCPRSTPPRSTSPYQTAPSWLPALPFDLPPEYQVRGYAPPDTSQFGPAIAGRIDPEYPDIIRGRWHGRLPDDGGVVTLTWNLNRAGECSEDDSRRWVRQQSQLLDATLQAGATQAMAGRPPTLRLVAYRQASSYSVPAVTNALHSSLGADYVTVRPGTGASEQGGIVRFGLRLGSNDRLLQSLDAIRRTLESTCVPDGSFEGARTIVVGAVQWTGDQYRVSVRRVDTETAEIRDAVTEDGQGGIAPLSATLQNMMLNIAAGG